MTTTSERSAKGLRQFMDAEQQRGWLDGKLELTDSSERQESIEHRFKYAHRFDKLLGRPQAPELLDILARYGRTCLPLPRATEGRYWSVSCLPWTSDKPLVRVNASWMELFTLYADGNDLRARFILHLSDFTRDGSLVPEAIDQDALEACVNEPEDLSFSCPQSSDLVIVRVRGAGSIRGFMTSPHGLRAIRRFNLTHLNRGRNAYQASHCYQLADIMLYDTAGSRTRE